MRLEAVSCAVGESLVVVGQSLSDDSTSRVQLQKASSITDVGAYEINSRRITKPISADEFIQLLDALLDRKDYERLRAIFRMRLPKAYLEALRKAVDECLVIFLSHSKAIIDFQKGIDESMKTGDPNVTCGTFCIEGQQYALDPLLSAIALWDDPRLVFMVLLLTHANVPLRTGRTLEEWLLGKELIVPIKFAGALGHREVLQLLEQLPQGECWLTPRL